MTFQVWKRRSQRMRIRWLCMKWGLHPCSLLTRAAVICRLPRILMHTLLQGTGPIQSDASCLSDSSMQCKFENQGLSGKIGCAGCSQCRWACLARIPLQRFLLHGRSTNPHFSSLTMAPSGRLQSQERCPWRPQVRFLKYQM